MAKLDATTSEKGFEKVEDLLVQNVAAQEEVLEKNDDDGRWEASDWNAKTWQESEASN